MNWIILCVGAKGIARDGTLETVLVWIIATNKFEWLTLEEMNQLT